LLIATSNDGGGEETGGLIGDLIGSSTEIITGVVKGTAVTATSSFSSNDIDREDASSVYLWDGSIVGPREVVGSLDDFADIGEFEGPLVNES